jgi:uncharacterized protein (TIGR02246 family)
MRAFAIALFVIIGAVAPAAQAGGKGKKAATAKARAQTKPPAANPVPDVQIEVRAALIEYSKALAAHDAAKAATFYTDDVTIWGNRKLRGKEAIAAWLKDFTSLKTIEMILREPLVRAINKTTVTVLGHWDSTVSWEESGKLQTTSAKDGSFLYVMLKQDGRWRVQTALVARKQGIGTTPSE